MTFVSARSFSHDNAHHVAAITNKIFSFFLCYETGDKDYLRMYDVSGLLPQNGLLLREVFLIAAHRHRITVDRALKGCTSCIFSCAPL